MFKKLTVLSTTILLSSTAALAGGGNEGYTDTNNYNEPSSTTTDTSTMSIMGNPTYLYLGAEAGWLNADPTGGFTNSNNFWTLAPVVGVKVGQYFGLEGSYTWSTSEHDALGDVRLRDYAIDAMGYLPINSSKTLELVGLVGVGRYDSGNNSVGSEKDTALRYGGGLQYELNNNWSTRLLYRRAEVKTAALDGADTVTLGLTYNFR